jgi:hypothetical protein
MVESRNSKWQRKVRNGMEGSGKNDVEWKGAGEEVTAVILI